MLQLFSTRIIPADERDGYDRVPPRSFFGRMLPWLIPAIVMGGFVWGFSSGKADQAMDAAVYWILVNGILTALGCFLAFGHPLTAVSGFIAAPITSLTDDRGWFVTAFVQTLLVKPRVRDIEQIKEKTLKIRQWWHNRLTKVFLVFLFSSIGSSIGTFVALPVLLKLFGR
jgi:pheromone shutdown protein TraB